LQDLHAEGGQTALIDAVYLAIKKAAGWRERDAARRRAVVLVTDGEERASYYKLSRLQSLLHSTSVQLFAIGLTGELEDVAGFTNKSPRERAVQLLASIARESGGRTFYPKKVKEIVEAVNQIARDMRTQDVVGYALTNTARDGKFRRVEVTVETPPGQPKRIAFARPGYLAPGASADDQEEGGKKKKKKGGDK
ncbi:MAG: VWA domain-containing protein, partial [Acidobacteria bacterium]|nr:VWA domain-containing protein [Acidobacteriota bacterium]